MNKIYKTVADLAKDAEANGAKLYIIKDTVGNWVGATAKGLMMWPARQDGYRYARPYTGPVGALVPAESYNAVGTGYLETMARN